MTSEAVLRFLLRAVARVVPVDKRADWLGEWEAELAFDRRRHAQGRKQSTWRLTRLVAALQHAVFLRIRLRGSHRPGVWFGLRDDFRHAFRGVRRTPLFSGTVILTLALGVGLVTGILAFADGYLFRPLPFPGADRAYYVRDPNGRFGQRISATDARLLRESDIGHYGFVEWSGSGAIGEVTVGGANIETFTFEVSPGFRKTLELPLTAGRDFTPEDHREGAPVVAWLSYRFWQRAFRGDPNVLHNVLGATGPQGKTEVRVIGVLGPEVATFDSNNRPPDLVVPARGRPREGPLSLAMPLVRLPADVSVEQAAGRMAAILQSGAPASDERPRAVRLSSFGRLQLSGGAPTARILFAGAALLMLLVAMNLVHLMLGRGEMRTGEAVTRVALGASRWRLTRALMIESVVLGACGIALGVLAGKGLSLVIASRLPGLPTAGRNLSMMPVLFDGRVMLIGAAAGLIAACAGGWWTARRAWRASLEVRARTPTRRTARLARVILASELAVVTVVAAGSVFAGTGIYRYLNKPLGFDLTDRLEVTLVRTGSRVSPVEISAALDALRTTPGVRVAAATFVTVAGEEAIQIPGVEIDTKRLSPQGVPVGLFETWGWQMTAGRWFDANEFERTEVAVVNEHLARAAWPNGGAVGATIRTGPNLRTVVGVIASHRWRLDLPLRAEVFVPAPAGATRLPLVAWAPNGAESDVQARAAAAIESAVPGITARVHPLTFDTYFARGLGEARFQAPIVTAFAVFAALLAVVGVFGVVSFLVSQRTREFGIRMAMGARQRDLHASVMRESLGPALAGVCAGALGAWALSKIVRAAAFEWEASGTQAVVIVVAGLLAVAAIAAFVPAGRAAKVDPASSLRER